MFNNFKLKLLVLDEMNMNNIKCKGWIMIQRNEFKIFFHLCMCCNFVCGEIQHELRNVPLTLVRFDETQ